MASERPPDAFLSYTRFDDQNDGGAISKFRLRLASSVRAITGEPFEIFQDVDGIGIGEYWPGKLDRMLDEVRFFIPILTPNYFRSKACRGELEQFLKAEKDRGRNDLVLPIYYIESEILEDSDLRAGDLLAAAIHKRQRQDWRKLRYSSFSTKAVKLALDGLAKGIVRARSRSMLAMRSAELDPRASGASRSASEGPAGDRQKREARKYTIRSGDTLAKVAAAHGTTLQMLLDANPEYRDRPGVFNVGDVILIPSLLGRLFPSLLLGSLSSRYETGGCGPGTVSSGVGDAGGVSYGSYQMTSRPSGGTVARFVADADFPWRARFASLKPGSPEFSAAWKAVATEAPDAFFEAQHAFIKRTHFDPLVARIMAEDGLDLTLRSPAVRDVIWSTAVQHGPNTLVVHRAIAAAGGAENLQPPDQERDRRLIEAIYAERGRRAEAGNLVYFARNSKAVQEGVARRFRDEERDALRMLDGGVV